ncbi:uncharacterized protein EKO05_0003831 [Ascochyta rabiei]|nr:uncharacterized protein EKO05_0003831 [Ascochyta rabiei]UPX13315.1 hypothetical protein EKO05_0003831 [Ascochyta rabiei]
MILATPVSVDEFTAGFDNNAILVVTKVMELLLGSRHLRPWCDVTECTMGDAEDEDIANEDCVWAPSYVIKFKNLVEEYDTRLIGHVEYLAGKSEALSEAYRLRQTAKWGSLRCVLGDLVQWMLMANLRYSFLVSSDEIIFLRIDIKEKKVGGKTVLFEPWLNYSEPMRITDAFDAGNGTITVRMALLHILWLVAQNEREDWSTPDETGNCLNYAVFTEEGEDWELRRPKIPEPSFFEERRVEL